jgi:hypothetical protein
MKKLPFYFLIVIILASCNAVKWIPANEHLLTQSTIYIDSTKTSNAALTKFIIQKPNTKTLGIFPLSLNFYNLGNPNKPKTPLEWGKKNATSYRFIKNIFSEKQSIAYANSFIGFNQWFLKNGQKPVMIDDNKTSRTIENLETYYTTIGYFKSKVTAKATANENKKGTIEYFISEGNPVFLDTISTDIQSPVLDSLYQNTKEESFLKFGDQYNEKNFIAEAARITKLFRNNGAYFFSNSSIGFYNIDSTRTDYKTNVLLRISKRIIEEQGNYTPKNFEIQKLRNVTIITDYTYEKRNQPYRDTLFYKGFNFLAHEKVNYNPKYLSQSLFLTPKNIYSDSLRNLTRSHLKTLKNFKTISINFNEVENEELETMILLSPIEKYTLGLDTELTHSNIRELGVSGKFSLRNRNTFKGAELLKMSFLGSYFDSQKGPGWEFGTDLTLEVPRLLAPFGLSKFVPKRMFPRTLFSVGTSIQKNIGLDRQTFSALANYKWQYNPKKTIELDVFNTQYIKNLNIDKYFDIYNSEYNKLREVAKIFFNDPNYILQQDNTNDVVRFMREVSGDANFKNSNPLAYSTNQNIRNRYNIIVSDFLIPVIAYTYTYNNQSNFKDSEFSYFKVRIANSGNLIGALSNQQNSNQTKTVFGIPIAEYFKTDIEFKHFWDLGNHAVFGVRTFLGAIFPYDGSSIPFTKSYFAGGSNDIRAWQTYSLGPGSRNTGLEFNVGSLKLLTSAEYRFNIFNSFKGALFLDAGNIWDVTNSSFVEEDAKFNSLSSLEDIAIGTGFGVRYDLNFLVVRFDIGFKTYEPYLTDKKWFQNYRFSSAVYNIGINYPF